MSQHDRHIKTVLKLFRQCGQRYDRYSLFSDCMELIALAISNSVDGAARARRETRYLEIIKRYDRNAVEMFPQILAEITMALEVGPNDVLGRIFAELEIHNSQRGQFFTPYSVCRLMAQATLGDVATARAIMAEKGYVTAMEPACGSGAMVIALAEAMIEANINYQRHLHVTAVDIDPRAVHMAYAQFSLLHIPAEVIVGNSLSMEMHERWFTPSHVLGGWSARLAADRPTVNVRSGTESVPAVINSAVKQPVQPSPKPGPALQLSLF